MDQVWIRLHNGWSPVSANGVGFGWALWQPQYVAAPWPHDELKPDFGYYVCEEIEAGGRGITAKATVEDVLPLTEAVSAEEAYRLVSEHLFNDDFTIDEEAWHANGYNKIKASAPWPQLVTAWRSRNERVGPYVLEELGRFPRTGWLRTLKIAM